MTAPVPLSQTVREVWARMRDEARECRDTRWGLVCTLGPGHGGLHADRLGNRWSSPAPFAGIPLVTDPRIPDGLAALVDPTTRGILAVIRL